MKKVFLLLIGLLCLNLTAIAQMGQAFVQVVHNSADPTAEIVDIYINGQKPSQLDDFEFRGTTPYLPLPSGIDINVTISDPTSQDVNDGEITTINLGQLTADQSYIVIANGIVNEVETYQNPDPNNRNIGFDLNVISGGTIADTQGKVGVKVFHGVTDAPAVDVYLKNTERGEEYPENPQIAELGYLESTDFVELEAETYNILVTAAGNPEVVVAEYVSPLSTAQGAKLALVASGFLTVDDENQNVASESSFGLNAIIPLGSSFLLPEAEFANVQVIHNAADLGAEFVDVYINGQKIDALDNFQFRSAIPYTELPAGLPLSISINDSSSASVNDGVLGTFDIQPLQADNSYVIVANGVIEDGHNNPGGMERNIDFDLYPVEGKLESGDDEQVSISAFHGATDAPAVDIYVDIEGDPFIPALDYSEFSGWVDVSNSDLELTVTVAGDKETVAGSFSAPLSNFGGQSLFIFASGFLSADDEPNMPMGRDFGLYVATSEGDVIELPSASAEFAFVQVIHNAANPIADIVDIYANGQKPDQLDDFGFREATEYLEFPVGEPIEIKIALPTSTNSEDSIVDTFEVGPLEAGMSYVLVANGVNLTDDDGFNSPDVTRDISLDLYGVDGKQISGDDTQVSISAFHGATDAPAVDIYVDIEGDPFIPNLDYSDFSGWVDVANVDLQLIVTVAGDKETVAGTFAAPLSGFGGESLFIFASGFLTPNDEPEMPIDREFGLFVATADGEVIELPFVDNNKAFVQVIHNSANPIADIVDIYVNDFKPFVLDDFAFRSATEYLELIANEPVIVKIALPTSTGPEDGIIDTFDLGVLEAGMSYVLVANGANVLDGDNFNSPDEIRDINLNLFSIEGRQESGDEELVSISAWHGATDAPAVDIYTDIEGDAFIPNLDYAGFSEWVDVPNQDLNLTVTVAGNKETVAGIFAAPLSLFGGESLFIFASGFLTSDDEPNMPMDRDFGLFVATATGDVLPLSLVNSLNLEDTYFSTFPNPSNDGFTITSDELFNQVEIFDMKGNKVFEEKLTNHTKSLDILTKEYNTGKYLIVVKSGYASPSVKMHVITK